MVLGYLGLLKQPHFRRNKATKQKSEKSKAPHSSLCFVHFFFSKQDASYSTECNKTISKLDETGVNWLLLGFLFSLVAATIVGTSDGGKEWGGGFDPVNSEDFGLATFPWKSTLPETHSLPPEITQDALDLVDHGILVKVYYTLPKVTANAPCKEAIPKGSLKF